MWGDHIRGADIIESGKVTTLEEGDLVEIIVDQGTAPQPTQIEVEYMVGSEKFKTYVDRACTIEQLKQRLNFTHKGRGIRAIASEGLQIADEDPVEDWLQRTAGIPLIAVLSKKVQVVVDFRGAEKHFTIQVNATEDEFKVLVRNFLGLGQRIHVAVMPLGLDDWEIRAGTTYWVAETRQMDIWISDTAHNRTHLKIAGNSSLNQVCEALRSKWNLPALDDIRLARADKTPFWVEEKGEYTAVVRYDPDKDLRPRCTVKIVTTIEHKIFLIENYRPPAMDPMVMWTDICLKYGFINPGQNLLQIAGHPDDYLVTYTYKVSASLVNVKLPPYISRSFKITIDEDEWDTGEILSPMPWGRQEIWEQLSAVHPFPHFSQFLFHYSAGEVQKTSRTLPQGHITVTRIRFPIKWRLELFPEEVIQDDMHAGLSIQDAWERLHHQVPRLYPHATFNCAGQVQPNLTVTAEVLRENITLMFCFEVKDDGWIGFPNNINK
jgi:hypothetical protein